MIEEQNQIEPNSIKHSLIDKIFKKESSLYIYLDKQKRLLGIEDIAKETFSSILNTIFKELKDSMSKMLLNTERELNQLFDEYSKEMNNYISFKEAQMFNLPGIKEKLSSQSSLIENDVLPLYSFIEKNIFSKLITIIKLNTSIKKTIQSNISLMIHNLNAKTLIKERNPLEKFVANNIHQIMSSWFLSNINFDNINLSHIPKEQEIINNFCKNFIFKKREKNYTCIDYNNSKNKNTISSSSIISFIINSIDHLKKVKTYALTNKEMQNILNHYKDLKLSSSSNLSSLKLLECNFRDQEWKPISIKGLSLPLKNLHLKKTVINFNLIQAITIFPQLKHLTLKKCNLNDLSFNNLIEIFRNNDKLLLSLEKISLAGNHLTCIPSILVLANQLKEKKHFASLKELNFENNNIYDIANDNFFSLPNIKIVNLCNNNFSSFSVVNLIIELNKSNKCLLLFAGNICLVNNKTHNNNYFNYLNKTLASFDFPLKKLSLAYVFNSKESTNLLNVTLYPYTNLYLQRLNLSNCNLDTDTVVSFIRNNGGLINLTHLVLNNNKIKMDLFAKINEENNALERLKKIDLSYNDLLIENDDIMNSVSCFCKRNYSLKLIKIQNTHLERAFMTKLENINIDTIFESKDPFDVCIITMSIHKKRFEIQVCYQEKFETHMHINNENNFDKSLKELIRFKYKNI